MYTRVCHICTIVETSFVAPPNYDTPVPVPSHEVVFKDKIAFLIKLATTITKQRPGALICYIAGKVTGLPKAEVRSKFAKKKLEMELKGFIVLNPIDFIGPDENWQIAMRMALPLLMMSDVICMLPCWRDSDGAKIEFEMAAKFGISTITE